MRFKKSNCRKKMVFSQPDVSRLEAVGVKEAFTFGLRLNFANTKPTSNYALNPQLLQTAVI